MTRPCRHLYIHVPFCAGKCDYCAFYSVPDPRASDIATYLQRLDAECAASAPHCGTLQSVFIGGGTPSLLSAPHLSQLFRSVARIPRAVDAELTVECNPHSLDAPRLDAMAAGGANRISLGVQTWDPALRSVLGRHTPLRSPQCALQQARAAGIQRINCDLIYAIPGQTIEGWGEDLKRTCDLGVESLSAYALTVEEGTHLAGRLDDEHRHDIGAAMWELAEEVLKPYGLHRYEVSNFAKTGAECRHNQAVWHGEPYRGCGPAACSFDGTDRFANPADLTAWLDGHPAAVDSLPPERRAREILAFGLRTVRGWTVAEFAEITGFDPGDLAGNALQTLVRQGLVASCRDLIRPTRRGLLFADTVTESLL